MDVIIKAIKDNLLGVKKEEADEIIDVVEMAKEELTKPEPIISRLRNCITLIAPMMTIAMVFQFWQTIYRNCRN